MVDMLFFITLDDYKRGCRICALSCLLKPSHHYMQIVCNKVREGDQRIVRIKEGNPQGRHVVIVDDLVQSGGTLIECQVHTFSVVY